MAIREKLHRHQILDADAATVRVLLLCHQHYNLKTLVLLRIQRTMAILCVFMKLGRMLEVEILLCKLENTFIVIESLTLMLLLH